MGSKEALSSGHIESWHALTKDWKLPDIQERAALVIGCRDGNIGEAIWTELLKVGFGLTHGADITAPVGLSVDINDDDDIQAVNFELYDTLILANGQTNLEWIEDQTLEKIQSVIDNKLTGTIKAVSEFARMNIDKQNIKNIVIIGSMAHKSVLNASAPYCAACAGINHFVRCAAWELAPKGFRVFVVNPSNVEGTPMTTETIEGIANYRHIPISQATEYWGAVRALPEWLTKEDIATLVRRLVTEEEMRWLAGVPLDMGGGLR